MTIAISLLFLSLVLATGTLMAAMADRAARATAWRQIALERRWNSENNGDRRH